MFGSLKNQLRTVIEWKTPAPQLVFEIWSRDADEIKNASKLLVNPGQGCIFVYEGKISTVFTQPGLYELKTANIPFWTTITKLMQAFESEHKVGLYFFKTTQLTDLKWGTTSTIKYEDPRYKFPVGLRAFGNYTAQIESVENFFSQFIGARDFYSTDELRELINSRLTQPLTQILVNGKYSYTDIDSHRAELASQMSQQVSSEFTSFGLKLNDIRLEGTSFDEDTNKRINRIADMSAESQAAQSAGVSYAQMQQLEALKEAAKNPSGGAGNMVGIGVGLGLGQQISGNLGGNISSDDPTIRLKKIKDLFDNGLITEEEFNQKKKEILSKI